MKQAELIALAGRCERAESSEQCPLLIEAFKAIHGEPIVHHPMGSAFLQFVGVGAYESAALFLAPENHAVDLTLWGPLWKGKHRARVLPLYQDGDRWLHRGSDPDYCSNATTPALALTAACLRALAAMEPTDDSQ